MEPTRGRSRVSRRLEDEEWYASERHLSQLTLLVNRRVSLLRHPGPGHNVSIGCCCCKKATSPVPLHPHRPQVADWPPGVRRDLGLYSLQRHGPASSRSTGSNTPLPTLRALNQSEPPTLSEGAHSNEHSEHHSHLKCDSRTGNATRERRAQLARWEPQRRPQRMLQRASRPPTFRARRPPSRWPTLSGTLSPPSYDLQRGLASMR